MSKKPDARIPEKIAYDAANDAYQRSWRSDEALRRAFNEAQATLLAAEHPESADAAFEVFIAAKWALSLAEGATAVLLRAREESFKILVQARGF